MMNNGITLWFTGLPSSGKTTLGSAIIKRFNAKNLNAVLLDGDILRKGINSDLDFSPSSRHENIRRTAEVANLFAQNQTIAVVTLISPYKNDRNLARQIHEKNNIKFIEIFVQTPLTVCEKRDVKGLYKKARDGLLLNMTGIQSPYEEPDNPDIIIDTTSLNVDECVNKILKHLDSFNSNYNNGLKFESKIPETIPELFVEDIECIDQFLDGCSIELTEVDQQWLQILAEGWAFPLKGFMNEKQYLQCLHFNPDTSEWHNMPLPIVLAIDIDKKLELEESNMNFVNLYHGGVCVARIKNYEIFPHRKEERVSRKFTTTSMNHPVMILQDGNYLIGGDVEVFKRFVTYDGLCEYRLTPNQIRERIKEGGYDAVFAFQLRNPIHNGHALLIKNTHRMLLNQGYENPLLLLHPLGGFTKSDDLPLYYRIKQHEALFNEDVLDAKTTLLAIFPSPMSYAGPTEVIWHCRARLICGATHYIVGRDPAGLPNPDDPSQDLFEPTHGAKVLLNSPNIENLKIIPFTVVAYNKVNKSMELYDPNNSEEFEFISGTKMRKIAREGGELPPGFMAKKAWEVVANYFRSQKQ